MAVKMSLSMPGDTQIMSYTLNVLTKDEIAKRGARLIRKYARRVGVSVLAVNYEVSRA